MTISIISEKAIINFKPTYLYIKQHKITKLCYFGKTCKTDPDKYSGSGKHWVNHIHKHGVNNVDTLWVMLFTDINDLVDFALLFSEMHDIVNSSIWANMKIEDGLTGGSNGKYSEESKAKMREAWKTRAPVSDETKAKLSAARKNRPSGAKGCIRSEDAKQKAIATRMLNGGCKHSEETKEKMRKPKISGHGEKVSAALKGRPKSLEHRQKLSDAARLAHTNRSSLSTL